MSVTPLTTSEIFTMVSKLKFGKIGNGKVQHMSKGSKTTLCGKYLDVFLEAGQETELQTCKRCYVTAEKNYRMDRKISYGCMRDAELDRMTYGGKPFTKAEEEKAIGEYMEYAGRTTDADITILTADGFVECTPEILAEALTELAEPSICAHGYVVAIQDGQTYVCGDCTAEDAAFLEFSDEQSAEYADQYLNAIDEIMAEKTEGKWDSLLRTTSSAGFHSIPEYDPNDGMDSEDNSSAPLIVEALLSVHMEGVTVSLGWKTITVPVGSEKSLATLYAEQSGSTWHRVGAPKWDSIITVLESYV